MGGQQGSNPFGGSGNPFGAIMGNPMGQTPVRIRRKKGRKVRYPIPFIVLYM
jgi:hypothetical protein